MLLSLLFGSSSRQAAVAPSAKRKLHSSVASVLLLISDSLVGDIIVSQERGKYIAYTAVANILGPSLSPFLGGVLSQYAGWHW